MPRPPRADLLPQNAGRLIDDSILRAVEIRVYDARTEFAFA